MRPHFFKRLLLVCLSLVTILSLASAQSPGSGNTLNFDGSDDRVVVTDDALLDIQDEITIEFWFKLNGSSLFSVFGRPVTKGQTGLLNGAYGIWIRDVSSADDIGFRFISTTNTRYEIRNDSLPNYDDGDWHHVAAVYSNSADRAFLYFDGVLEALDTISGDVKIRSTGDNLNIGGASARPFNGYIDEVRIWDMARSQTQVRDNMCNKLAGSESNLIGYWNLDSAALGADSVPDLTSNDLDGTMTNMTESDIEYSGAPIGDSSVYVYTVSASTTNLNIGHVSRDSLTIDFTAGTADGFYLYRVDTTPNVTTPPGTQTQLSLDTYYGTKAIGSSGLTYTVIYDYDGHAGIINEADLELAKRDNNADMTWSQESAVLDTTANTLTLSGQTGTEYILASIGIDPLPIELLSFTIKPLGAYITINWQTASEINNDYFTIERSFNGLDWEVINTVEGAHNSKQTTNYTTIDNAPLTGRSYYRLKQTDFDGSCSYSDIRSVMINKNIPVLLYPNPMQYQIFVEANATELEYLTIQNAFGQDITAKVTIENIASSILRIELANLPDGLYIVKTASTTNKVLKR